MRPGRCRWRRGREPGEGRGRGLSEGRRAVVPGWSEGSSRCRDGGRASKRLAGIEPASSPWKGEALPLSYSRAREAATAGGSATATAFTNDLAHVDLP